MPRLRSARLTLVGAVAAVAASAAVSAAGAAGPAVRIVETAGAGASFPQRTYVLVLPSGQRLDRSRVSVQENGQDVPGVKVVPASAANRGGFGTVLAVDASNSMRGRPIVDAMAATRAFAKGRNVNQRLALVTFNQKPQLALPFTTSQTAIRNALGQHPRTGAGTRLYDAVAQSIALLQVAGVRAGTVVVLSDGHDTGSSIGIGDLASHARAAGVRLFTVALASPTARPGALRQLAQLTGGSYSEAGSSRDLTTIYRALGLQLARDYLVSYHSRVPPGEPVKVAVKVAGLGSAQADYVTPGLPEVPTATVKTFSDRLWQSTWTMLALALLIPLIIALVFLPPVMSRGSTVRDRLSDFVSMPRRRRERKPMASRIFVGTERTLERSPWWSRFTAQLELAAISIPPTQIVVGVLVITLLVTYVLFQIAAPLALLGLATPLFARMAVNSRIDRRRRAFADQLPDNLDVLASGLRAGHGLVGALAVVVNDAPEPSRTEFQRAIGDEQLGVALEDTLETVALRMKNRDLEQVALVASLQSETGGNAAEVLDRVTENIRGRAEIRRLIRTLTAQGRMARWVVTALPVLLLLAITLLNPDYMKPLYHHTSGQVAIAIAVSMVIAGSVVIGRIVNIEV